MCGRFTLTATSATLQALFGYQNQPTLAPRWNVAPTQPVPVVRPSADGGRELVMLRWGLVPHRARHDAPARVIVNARAETAAESPFFRDAFCRRRCLVPADGFYEWRTENGKRQPFRIGMKGGGVFAFAGLWECWIAPTSVPALRLDAGEALESLVILTTEANEKLRPIHGRMPAILAPGAYDRWLDVTNCPPTCARALLGPYPSNPMAFYRVGTRVNDARNDDARCIAPLRAAG